MKWWRNRQEARARREAEDREKEARLVRAEAELAHWEERKDRALSILSARDRRNHWRESITLMIEGRAS